MQNRSLITGRSHASSWRLCWELEDGICSYSVPCFPRIVLLLTKPPQEANDISPLHHGKATAHGSSRANPRSWGVGQLGPQLRSPGYQEAGVGTVTPCPASSCPSPHRPLAALSLGFRQSHRETFISVRKHEDRHESRICESSASHSFSKYLLSSHQCQGLC